MKKKKDTKFDELSTLARQLFVVAPWERFASDCFLSIVDENENEYFLSFSEGIHCLPGAEGLRSYLRLLHNMDDDSAHYALRSISLTQNEKGEYEFRSYYPGHVVWELLDYEIDILLKVYSQAIELLTWIHDNEIEADFANFESPTRTWNAEKGSWVNEVHKLRLARPNTIPNTIIVNPPDELTMFRISARPHVDATLELDVFMVEKSAVEQGYEKPFYPTMIVLCDRPNNRVLDLKLLAPDKDIPQESIDIIVSFIDRYGIPEILYVQSAEVFAMLAGVCDEIGVRIERVGFLPAINNFKLEKDLL